VNGRESRIDRHEDCFESIDRVLVTSSSEWLVRLNEAVVTIDRLSRSSDKVCVNGMVPGETSKCSSSGIARDFEGFLRISKGEEWDQKTHRHDVVESRRSTCKSKRGILLPNQRD
jgi:hypothetical protein